jgi:peptidoglycan/LPS O-acetylase OafA/YrhL
VTADSRTKYLKGRSSAPLPQSRFPNTNNFDLLRLLAALQVVYVHTVIHLDLDLGLLGDAIQRTLIAIPGVPVFFIISGFLISSSYERRGNLGQFAYNRALRIFPALWVCLAATIILLGVGGFLHAAVRKPSFPLWALAQATVGQFFNLNAFRGFGVGVPNGSVWTITVELAFYGCIPIIYYVLIERQRIVTANIWLVAIGIVSWLIGVVTYRLDPHSIDLFSKVIDQTPAPHLFLFVIGILAQRNFHRIRPWVEGKAFVWTMLYFPLVLLLPSRTESPLYDVGILALRVLLAGWLLSVAFSWPTVAGRLLRRNDVSYGMYLYHMLIVNIFVEYSDLREPWILPLIVCLSALCGLCSWVIIERPMLRRKRPGYARNTQDGTNSGTDPRDDRARVELPRI